MNDSEILIIGSNGQLGRALQSAFPNARAVDSDQLDITNSTAIHNYNWSGIRVIINAAAYTNVDGAETIEGRLAAWNINASAVVNLVLAAQQHDLTLVHISSDYVFDGTKSPHSEDEPYSPLGVYGQSKAAGDIAAGLTPKHYIIRTSWVIGDGKNFVRTMLDLGKKGVNPTVVADQIGRLTFTSELVRAIQHLLSTNLRLPYGTYNISNDGQPASWADITREIYKLAGYENIVTDTTTSEYYAGKEGIAPRPLQSTLDLAKIQATGFVCKDWRDELKQYIQEELNR